MGKGHATIILYYIPQNDSGGSIRNLDLCKIQEDRWTSISLDFAILYDHQSGIPAKNDIIREDQPVPVVLYHAIL